MARARRAISRAKTYGFHPWLDQVDAIDQIVKETGVKESIVLRKLIDEALVARRTKGAEQEIGRRRSASQIQDVAALQSLLVKVLRQGEVSLRVQDVILSVLQDTLAEARAGRKVSWEHLAATLKERGTSGKDLSKRFDRETADAKDFAYGTAKEIKRKQKR